MSAAFFRRISMTAVCSLSCFSEALFPSFFVLCMRLGVRTMARFEVPILLCCEHDATLARNLMVNCSVLRCGIGSKRQSSNTASVWSPWSSIRWVFMKQSWSRTVRSGSGSCLKNCFTKLATSWGWTFLNSSPFSALCCLEVFLI